jgi:hypothetical protein
MIVCIENYNTKAYSISYPVAERLFCSNLIFIPIAIDGSLMAIKKDPIKIKSMLYTQTHQHIITLNDIQTAGQYHEAGLNVILEGRFDQGIGQLVHQFWPTTDIITILICKEEFYRQPPSMPIDCIIDANGLSDYTLTQIISKRILQIQHALHKN